jgi:hypothetical protein
MSSENEDLEEKREEKKINVSIDDVEEEMLKHWRWLCEVNPGWRDAERIELQLGVRAELVSPQLTLQHPELLNNKKREREDDHDLPGVSEIRRPLVKTKITTNNVVLHDINDVLRPRKIESDWHKHRRETQEKRDESNKRRKEKIVVANRKRRLEQGIKTTQL